MGDERQPPDWSKAKRAPYAPGGGWDAQENQPDEQVYPLPPTLPLYEPIRPRSAGPAAPRGPRSFRTWLLDGLKFTTLWAGIGIYLAFSFLLMAVLVLFFLTGGVPWIP